MIKSFGVYTRAAMAILAGVVLLSFQNCGQNFEIQKDFASFDASSLAVPQITFALATETINTPDYNLSFEILGVAPEKVKSVLCEVTGKTPQACNTKTLALTALVDGDYQIKVTVETVSGVKNNAIKLLRKDGAAPIINVASMPAAITNQTTASFTFTVMDNLSGVDKTECSYDNGVFAACVSPFAIAVVGAGAHNLKIRSFDKATNPSAVYNYAWTVDLTAPTVNITGMPLALTNQTSANFTFAGTGIVSYECQIDAVAFAACASPKAYTALTAGPHMFKVRGTNAAGTVSAPTTFSWTIDNVAPAVPTLTSNVTNPTALTAATFTFVATDAGSGIASYQCSLDSATFAACTSPKAYTGLTASVTHQFQVRATDGAGNVSPVASFSWFIDGSGPVITLTGKPARLVFSPTANFSFTATDTSGVASVLCSWKSLSNSITPANCAGGTASYTGLNPSNYTFVIVARDNTGQETTLEYAWDVDDAVGTPIQFKYIGNSSNNSCGITMSNSVKCWGDGGLGLIGNGTMLGTTVPVDATGLTSVKALSMGTIRACAILSNDSVRCWGVNFGNYLGTGVGSGSYDNVPADVVGLGQAKAIASGYDHSCIITPQNTVKCWGGNEYGQLGENTKVSSGTAVDVINLGTVKSLTLSLRTSCAITTDDKVKCWGNGSNILTELPTFAGSTEISVLDTGLCGRTAAGIVHCGNLNNGISTETIYPSIQGAQSIARSNYSVCGILAGSVKCASLFNLGPPYSFPSSFPTLDGAKSLISSDSELCAITAENYVRCFGGYEVGYNSLSVSLVPIQIPNLVGVKKFRSSEAGAACFLTNQNSIKCMGNNVFGQLGITTVNGAPSMVPVDVPNLLNPKDLAVGMMGACAILADNTVKCWGTNTGSNSDLTPPVAVPGITDAQGIAAGYLHRCTYDSAGKVKCWGSNNYGELGNGTKSTTIVATPVDVVGLTGVKGIAAGVFFTCAITSDSGVACWGTNVFGTLGVDTVQETTVPIQIPNLTGVVSISAMITHACALINDGTVRCWGFGYQGQLGNGTLYDSYSPVVVTGLSGIVGITTGREQSCAVNNIGRYYCWGNNMKGAFGNGTTTSSSTPVLGNATKAVQAVGAGGSFNTYLIHQDGTVSVTGNLFPVFNGLAGPVKSL